MQRRSIKILNLILISFFLVSTGVAQVSSYRLQKADSLFDAKRFTQALAQYKDVINNQEYTPAMLLKMAYIHEGLGNIAQTQYFLSLYFRSTNDASAMEKMEELATKYNLEGYKISDKERVLVLYRKNAEAITIVMLAFMVLFVALAVRMQRQGTKPFAPAIALVLFTGLLATHFYFSSERASIIMQPNTYLMSGPSAGADVVEILDAGHKVVVKGKKDVWLKIRWREQDVYLKDGLVQPISL